MKKNLTLLAALALGVSALTASSVTGCELIASVDHSLLEGAGGMGVGGQNAGGAGGVGGQGGAGGTTTSSGGGGTGGCMGPTDCPDPDENNECIEPSCDADTCGSTTLADGTPIASQAMGDCKETQCADNGATTMVVDADDPFDDTKECTDDGCNAGMPTHVPKGVGVACTENGGTVCNAAGDCVECVSQAQCGAMEVCSPQGACIPDTCVNGVVDGEETDLNCGGTQCPACADLQDCLLASDCQSMVCTNLVCQVPSCTDGVTNGMETDLNCGGPDCPGCGTGDTCASGADCMSGVCQGNPLTCQAAMCGDGVTNASEVCDGGDLGGQDCTSQGFAGGGTLSCQAGCTGFNTGACNECDADIDCVMPTAPVCDVAAGNCEICVGASAAACGANETCNGSNDCACGAATSPTGPACTGTTNPNCEAGVGCFCAAAGAACGAGETCVVGTGCVCGDTANAAGAACGGGAATCTGGVGGVCDCNGGAAGGTCGAKESCEGGQCDCGPVSGVVGGQACPDSTGNPECFPLVGCRCGSSGSTCGAGETCSAVVGGDCTCGSDSNPVGEACPDTDEYRVCNAGVGCACEAGSCTNGFVCDVAAGDCECDGNEDCPFGGACSLGACQCEGAVTPCMIPGQTCTAGDACDCGDGSCED